MVELQIIHAFCSDNRLFCKYYKYVNTTYIKNNYPLIYKLFLMVNKAYEEEQDIPVKGPEWEGNTCITKEILESVYLSHYFLEDAERQELVDLITKVFDTEVYEDSLVNLLKQHKRRCLAGDLARIALDIEEGKESSDKLVDLMAEFELDDITEDEEGQAVEMDLSKLHESQVQTPGLRWRLNFLNRSLGSLRKGDFGFIFARPETGKTTFLASEITHMINQTEGDILWFNNEEQSKKVAIRVYQAVSGITSKELFNDITKYQSIYKDITNDRIKIFDFDDSNYYRRIENIIKKYNPALIIFDQIDKIKGFKGDRNDLELKAIYQWARELAKEYAPVIAVSQASGEAEGKLWLTMDMVDGSKTAKQGEADWILGIGREQDNVSRLRYLNITKNKLLGDPDSLPDLRHGQSQVLIKPEIARYEDI